MVNLRNLGENSTLTLVNGKRMAPTAGASVSGGEFVNINAIPQIMTERIEVLTDGGSAIYGADAVAGVVNIIMRNDFEGIEIRGDLQGVESAGDVFRPDHKRHLGLDQRRRRYPFCHFRGNVRARPSERPVRQPHR